MNDCRVDTEVEGGVLIARLEGEIDIANVDRTRNALADAVTNDILRVVIDLSEVTYLDSAAINVFLSLLDRLRIRGQELRLVVPPDSPVLDALRYAGVVEILAIRESVGDAL
jgi:anti-anti-sigma factor